MDRPEIIKVLEKRKEAEGIFTIRLDKRICAQPGQFVMLWLPDIGEKPFSMSSIKDFVEITFDIKGEFTKALSKVGVGDEIGMRGPYGKGWRLNGGEKILVVAGGLGLAPLMPVLESKTCGLVYGTRSKAYIKFKERLEKACPDVIYTTDDGSFGKHCYACDVLDVAIENGDYDMVLTCGPEIFMKKVVDICLDKGIRCQASLERFMKCGIGICGSCVIDKGGLRVCRDGPVFFAEQLKDSEFGQYHRDASGAKE